MTRRPKLDGPARRIVDRGALAHVEKRDTACKNMSAVRGARFASAA